MKAVNRFFKGLGYTGIQLLVILELYSVSLFVSSPFYLLLVCILDALRQIPDWMSGRELIGWLLVAVIPFIPLYIETNVKTWKMRHSK